MGPYYILPSEIYVLFDLRKTLETYTQIKDLNKIEHHQLDRTELHFFRIPCSYCAEWWLDMISSKIIE